MRRFDGYNRHDFHFPRTSKEAFGSNFNVVNKKSMIEVILVSIFVIFVTLFVFTI